MAEQSDGCALSTLSLAEHLPADVVPDTHQYFSLCCRCMWAVMLVSLEAEHCWLWSLQDDAKQGVSEELQHASNVVVAPVTDQNTVPSVLHTAVLFVHQ